MVFIVIMLFVVLLIYAPAALLAYTVLQPVAKAVRGKQRVWKFYISDFFPLTFLLAIPLIFVASARRWRGENATDVNVFGLILVAVFAYTWWRGTVALSTLGVLHAGRRCVFLGILLPIVLLGSAIGAPMLVVMTFTIPQMSAMGLAGWIVGIIAIPVIAWCCRKTAFWVLGEQEKRQGAAGSTHEKPHEG